MSDDDWHNAKNVVVREQLPIRCFLNALGDVAIIQKGSGDDEDQIVTVTLDRAPALISALSALVSGAADKD